MRVSLLLTVLLPLAFANPVTGQGLEARGNGNGNNGNGNGNGGSNANSNSDTNGNYCPNAEVVTAVSWTTTTPDCEVTQNYVKNCDKREVHDIVEKRTEVVTEVIYSVPATTFTRAPTATAYTTATQTRTYCSQGAVPTDMTNAERLRRGLPLKVVFKRDHPNRHDRRDANGANPNGNGNGLGDGMGNCGKDSGNGNGGQDNGFGNKKGDCGPAPSCTGTRTEWVTSTTTGTCTSYTTVTKHNCARTQVERRILPAQTETVTVTVPYSLAPRAATVTAFPTPTLTLTGAVETVWVNSC